MKKKKSKKNTTKTLPMKSRSEVLGFSAILPFDPVPASRARVPRFGKPYYTGKYAKWRPIAIGALRSMCPDEPISCPVFVRAEFIVEKPKTSKLSIPKGDLDNYLKALFDALNSSGIWVDDKQVVKAVCKKEFGHPGRTFVEIFGA